MDKSHNDSLVFWLRKLTSASESRRLSDCQLLERYVASRDEAAFEVLLHRHGAMVLRVCRSLLRETHAAEDAFQATFLILVRKAAAVGKPELLGNWLCGVAYRVARRARQTCKREDEFSHAVPAGDDPADRAASREVEGLLHEELQRLPAKYRTSLALCYLEGCTNEEAARRLNWPLGTLKVRLLRGRDMLRGRLARRGVTLSGAGLAAALTPAALAVPITLVDTTMKAAVLFAAGAAAGTGVLSASAVALTQGVLKTMSNRFKNAALALVALILLGAGWFTLQTLAAPEATRHKPVVLAGGEPKEDVGVELPGPDSERIKGVWNLVSAETGKGKKTADEIKKTAGRLTVSGGRIRLALGAAKSGMITLAADKKPKQIDLRLGGPDEVPEVGQGIYALDKDTLTICLNHLGSPRPLDFKIKAGSDWPRLLVFRRADKVDEQKLQGTWKIVAAKPESAAGEKAVFEGDKMTAFAGGKKIVFGFKVDSFAKPPKIDLTTLAGDHPGSMHLGVYELEGDSLKICVASFGKRPTDLSADPKHKQIEMVLKRGK